MNDNILFIVMIACILFLVAICIIFARAYKTISESRYRELTSDLACPIESIGRSHGAAYVVERPFSNTVLVRVPIAGTLFCNGSVLTPHTDMDVWYMTYDPGDPGSYEYALHEAEDLVDKLNSSGRV